MPERRSRDGSRDRRPRATSYPHAHSPRWSLRSRQRLRYVFFAIVVLFLFFSLSRTDSLGPLLESSSASPLSPEPKPIPQEDLPPTGPSPYRIQAAFPAEAPEARAARLERREKVKDAFLHAWTGYKKFAWLHDEVLPISGERRDTFVGWAATLVDSLDTLWIMELKEEFELALEGLKKIDFSEPNAERVPIFETNIRYLGGLLGAWDISGHKYPILIEKAEQLGNLLFQAFDTLSGIPVPYYWWQDGKTKMQGENGVLIAQIASLSLEFIRLSEVTGDMKFANAIQRITDQLEQTQNNTGLPGLWPSQADTRGPSLSFSSHSFTLGAFADSAYEYLPKTHLLLSSNPRPTSAQQYLSMYRFALASFTEHLFFRPSVPGDPDILFPGTWDTFLDPQVQHLACFVGGMVALGSRISKSEEEFKTATKLTEGCVWAYASTPSGMMPEIFHVDRCSDPLNCTWNGDLANFMRVDDSSYQLRPEAIESVFIMYRLTANSTWQEKGWKMFDSIMSHTKTNIANARYQNVMDPQSELGDSMESFWLAETLKYFYLLYSEPDLVSLDDFVLNTEAHPLKLGGPDHRK